MLAVLAATAPAAHAHSQAQACERPAQLRFSLIPQGEVKQDIAKLQPLFDDLEKALKLPVIVLTPSSYGYVVEGLLSGAVDLARLGPAAYVGAKKEDPLLTPFASYTRKMDIFNQASAAYYSLLITRADKAYQDLKSLQGKTVALVDPESTSGAMAPRKKVERETGASLEKFFGRTVYSGNHEKSVWLVLNNEADAAFVSSSHVSTLVESGKIQLGQLKILWRSELIPRDPFVFRGQLCRDIQERIRSVFFAHASGENQALLKNLKAVGFVPVQDSDYQVIRDLSSH